MAAAITYIHIQKSTPTFLSSTAAESKQGSLLMVPYLARGNSHLKAAVGKWYLI